MDLSPLALAVISLFLTGVSLADVPSLSYSVGSDMSGNLCFLDSCIPQEVSATSELFKACQQEDSFLRGRCCISKGNDTVLGIDLSHCVLLDLDVLNDEKDTKGYTKKNLQILLLDDNPLSDCGGKAFDVMTQLKYLSLPSNCSCPDGEYSWDDVQYKFNETVCQGKKCRDSGVTCPVNAHCKVHKSDFWCECDGGYYGYKCLRTGTFPTIGYVAGILISTAVISGSLWVISRRKVRKIE